MKYKQNSWLMMAILFFFTAALFTSCSTGKRVTYFQDIPDTLAQPLVKKYPPFVEPRIKTGDILSISITTIDAAAGAGAMSSQQAGGTSGVPTYLVDKTGNVDLPVVGRMSVANMTTSEVKESLYQKAGKYYVNPIINVRFANFSVTVLGDVLRPGTYPVANEKVSVLDAIGMAGDIAITGRRDNVLLIREENGQKIFVRLNLNTADIIQSPYFYLRSGDVLHVEPIKAKVGMATTDVSKERYIPYLVSGLSLLLSMANIIIQLNRLN
jgi:polysaccharide biosynthesis/export protein